MLQIHCKLYQWEADEQVWREKGNGSLKLNDKMRDGKLGSRLGNYINAIWDYSNNFPFGSDENIWKFESNSQFFACRWDEVFQEQRKIPEVHERGWHLYR